MIQSPLMRWKLHKYLEERGIQTRALAKLLTGKPRSNETKLYRLKNGDRVTSRFDSVEEIILALRELTGHDVNLFDIIEEVYEDDQG